MNLFTRDQIKNLKTKKNEPDESINYNGMNNIAVGGTPANVHALHHNDHECNSQVRFLLKATMYSGMPYRYAARIVRFTMIRLYLLR